MGAQSSHIGHHANRRNFPGRKPHRVDAFENGWAVFDADGKRVSKCLLLRQYANDLRREMDADLTQVGQKGVRPCITCSDPFKSEGPHNRMCDKCRRLPDTQMLPNSFARARRRA